MHEKSRKFILKIHNCSAKTRNFPGKMFRWSLTLLKLEACDFATNELHNSLSYVSKFLKSIFPRIYKMNNIVDGFFQCIYLKANCYAL